MLKLGPMDWAFNSHLSGFVAFRNLYVLMNNQSHRLPWTSTDVYLCCYLVSQSVRHKRGFKMLAGKCCTKLQQNCHPSNDQRHKLVSLFCSDPHWRKMAYKRWTLRQRTSVLQRNGHQVLLAPKITELVSSLFNKLTKPQTFHWRMWLLWSSLFGIIE